MGPPPVDERLGHNLLGHDTAQMQPDDDPVFLANPCRQTFWAGQVGPWEQGHVPSGAF
jgi:hypothetical protein